MGPRGALQAPLGVLRSFTLEAAEAVGAEPGAPGAVAAEEVLLLLGNLVEQSLVVAKPGEDEDTRYRMLELVRRYALEKLERARRHGTSIAGALSSSWS